MIKYIKINLKHFFFNLENLRSEQTAPKLKTCLIVSTNKNQKLWSPIFLIISRMYGTKRPHEGKGGQDPTQTKNKPQTAQR